MFLEISEQTAPFPYNDKYNERLEVQSLVSNRTTYSSVFNASIFYVQKSKQAPDKPNWKSLNK